MSRSIFPAGPSEVVVVGDGDPGVVAQELAAQQEHGDDAVCKQVATLDEAERIAPEHLVLLGDAEGEADRVRNAGAVFVGPWSPVAAGDYATGGNHVLPTNGWARSVGGLGLETFMKPVTFQRLHARRARVRAADGRGARRGRRDAGARGGGASMRALAPGFRPVSVGCDDGGGRADRRHRSVAGPALRPEHACAAATVDAPGDGRRRPRTGQRLPGRRLRAASSRDRRLHRRRAREHRARRRRRRPHPVCARARTPAQATRSRSPLLRRIRCTRSPRSSQARRSATTRCSPSRAGRTTRRAARPAARRPAARRRRGVLRVLRRDRRST